MSLEASRRGGKKVHEEKDELGRSVHGVKAAGRLHAIIHKEKDDLGRSVHAVEIGKAAHKEKDDLGRSIHAVKAATAMHKDKDDLGRSITAMKINNQVWESTIDGFRSHSGAVAQHNKARGWDPAARVKIT